MAMNPNVGMANMNNMGGAVGGAPMPMMNNGNGAINPQAAAAASNAHLQQMNNSQRSILNTYIYEYFLRHQMWDCARALLSSDSQVNVVPKDGAGRRATDSNGNAINGVDDPMDTDSKEDIDSKLPDDLPPPRLPMQASESAFLYEWFGVFWDIFMSQRPKTTSNNTVNQYVQHTQQNRLKQNQQQEMLRHMARGDMNVNAQYQAQIMRNMQNGPMGMKSNLARAAMANNQNPQMQMLQQAKQNQLQRDPSSMDNRDRPSSPASGDNAPSPSKRPRLDGAPFNPNHPGAMMANGRNGQGMPGQQMGVAGNVSAAQQMLANSGINPSSLNHQQMQNFVNAPPVAQQKSIASYSQNLQQHHGNQMTNKQMGNAGGPQGQGSPMMPQGPDGNALNNFYGGNEMCAPGVMRPGPGGAPGAAAGSNHALQDYQMQLMLLEQQNKRRLMMARAEQTDMGGMPRDGQPGGPTGPNGQPFPDTSPQAMRTGTSPNPTDQMKRGTPQMNNSGIPSPVPEGGQSRDSPNPAMNFMGNHVDPSMAPHFFKGMDGNMAAAAQAQINNGMRPPSSHPGQPFNGPMNPQQQMMVRQQQAQQQQQQQQQQQANQGNLQQWQPGPNGQMVPQGMQQNQQVQGPPQQRAMPPPSAPAAAANNANNRTTASPQQAAAAPPTPNQSNKAAPKTKKDTKSAKDKRAATQKKANQNLNNAGATPAGDNNGEAEVAAPATPITPLNAGGFNKNGQNGAAVSNGQASTAPTATTAVAAPAPIGTLAPPSAPVQQGTHPDLQNGGMNMETTFDNLDFTSLELVNPLHGGGDVLTEFDFDSFLHDNEVANEAFNLNGPFSGMEGGEIGAD